MWVPRSPTRYLPVTLAAPVCVYLQSRLRTVSLLTNGSGGSVPNNAFFRHDHAVAVLLKTDGKTVRKLGETEIGTLAEGIAFSPDGQFLYIANLGEQELAAYRLADNKLVRVGSPLKLLGHPASMRGSTP